MSFLELAKNRYTTKNYDPNQKISDEKIAELKEILRLSPSSINSQPWQFVFISDEKTKSQLADYSLFNKDRINGASHLVAFYAIDDIALFEKQIEANLPQGAVEYYQTNIKPKGEAHIKNWMQKQVYISLGYFLTACASMGIDSTPMEGIDNEKYNQTLGIDGYTCLFSVAIGYRNPEDQNQPAKTPKKRLPQGEVIREI